MRLSFYGIAVLTEVTKQLVWSSTVVVIVWNMEQLFGFVPLSSNVQLCSCVFQIVNYKVVCLPLWRWSRGKIREGCVSWTKAEVTVIHDKKVEKRKESRIEMINHSVSKVEKTVFSWGISYFLG